LQARSRYSKSSKSHNASETQTAQLDMWNIVQGWKNDFSFLSDLEKQERAKEAFSELNDPKNDPSTKMLLLQRVILEAGSQSTMTELSWKYLVPECFEVPMNDRPSEFEPLEFKTVTGFASESSGLKLLESNLQSKGLTPVHFFLPTDDSGIVSDLSSHLSAVSRAFAEEQQELATRFKNLVVKGGEEDEGEENESDVELSESEEDEENEEDEKDKNLMFNENFWRSDSEFDAEGVDQRFEGVLVNWFLFKVQKCLEFISQLKIEELDQERNHFFYVPDVLGDADSKSSRGPSDFAAVVQARYIALQKIVPYLNQEKFNGEGLYAKHLVKNLERNALAHGGITSSDLAAKTQKLVRATRQKILNMPLNELAEHSLLGLRGGALTERMQAHLGFSSRDLASAVQKGVQAFLFYLFSLGHVPAHPDGHTMENAMPGKFVCTSTILPFYTVFQDFLLEIGDEPGLDGEDVVGTAVSDRMRLDATECSVPAVDADRWGKFVQELLLGAPFLSSETLSAPGLMLNLAYVQRFAQAWRNFERRFRLDTNQGPAKQAAKEAEYYEQLIRQVSSGLRTIEVAETAVSRKETLHRLESSRGLLVHGLLKAIAVEIQATQSSVDRDQYLQMLRYSLTSSRAVW